MAEGLSFIGSAVLHLVAHGNARGFFPTLTLPLEAQRVDVEWLPDGQIDLYSWHRRGTRGRLARSGDSLLLQATPVPDVAPPELATVAPALPHHPAAVPTAELKSIYTVASGADCLKTPLGVVCDLDDLGIHETLRQILGSGRVYSQPYLLAQNMSLFEPCNIVQGNSKNDYITWFMRMQQSACSGVAYKGHTVLKCEPSLNYKAVVPFAVNFFGPATEKHQLQSTLLPLLPYHDPDFAYRPDSHGGGTWISPPLP